ncbi:hypothetical protein [Streptomyces sp. NPDC046197]|uniref:hypothetical protein n=1 Tax=Streptomyces sp. NPDC046197 TaxID=3154337 RepID=UPI0033DBD6AB
MAHAVPASGGAFGRTRTPDFFSPQVHAVARWAVPAVLGLVYGYWVAANRRAGGPITTTNFLFGLVTGIVFMLLMVGVLYLAPHLKRELHALLWFTFVGVTFGFLFIQSAGATIGGAIALSLAIGAAVGVMVFYWYYTHEDAEGHRI